MNLKNFNRTEIIQTVPSNYNKIKLEIHNRTIMGKFPNTWKLNNSLLSNPWVKEGVLREIKICIY